MNLSHLFSANLKFYGCSTDLSKIKRILFSSCLCSFFIVCLYCYFSNSLHRDHQQEFSQKEKIDWKWSPFICHSIKRVSINAGENSMTFYVPKGQIFQFTEPIQSLFRRRLNSFPSWACKRTCQIFTFDSTKALFFLLLFLYQS